MVTAYENPPLMGQAVAYDPAYAVPAPAEPGPRRPMSLAAVVGAVFVVIAVQLLLSLLGAGIGLGTVNANAGTTPSASSLGINAAIWWMVSAVIALVTGGYIAARLAGAATRWDGMLHGLVLWGLATLLLVALLTSAVGGIIGGGASALGGLASAAGSGMKAAAQGSGVTPDDVAQQAQAYLKPAEPDPAAMSPQDAQKAVAVNLAAYAKGGPDAAAARDRIIAISAAQQHIGADQAARQFDDAQAKLQQQKAQAEQAAKNAADAAAAAASKTSFAAFVDLLLGALAAAIGGALAPGRRPVVRA